MVYWWISLLYSIIIISSIDCTCWQITVQLNAYRLLFCYCNLLHPRKLIVVSIPTSQSLPFIDYSMVNECVIQQLFPAILPFLTTSRLCRTKHLHLLVEWTRIYSVHSFDVEELNKLSISLSLWIVIDHSSNSNSVKVVTDQFPEPFNNNRLGKYTKYLWQLASA